MTTTKRYDGMNRGFEDAIRYATGTRADRRAIRRMLVKAEISGSPWWRGYQEGFADAAEQRSWAISNGLAPRTINPHKLARVFDRACDLAS